MSEPIGDMPNQRPNPVGAGLASLAQFFSDSRVDQAKMQTMAEVLSRKGVNQRHMQRIVSTAMEECDRFPSLAWMLKLISKRRSDGTGWEDQEPFCFPDLYVKLSGHQQAFLAERNNDLWLIRRALVAGKEPTSLMEKWRLYLDHNRYVRSAPHGDLVVTHFQSQAAVEAEMVRIGANTSAPPVQEVETWTERKHSRSDGPRKLI